jgi:flagellar FliL protein
MAEDESKDAAEESKGGGKKKIIMILPVLLLLGGGGWFFFLRGGDEAPKGPPPPVPGEVVTLEPISINLAGGHFLKLGIALQGEASAPEIDGSKALDLAISQFSGRSMDELATPTGREKAKAAYLKAVKYAYLPHDVLEELEAAHEEASTGSTQSKESTAAKESKAAEESSKVAKEPVITVNPEVYDVYFTEFVMQ